MRGSQRLRACLLVAAIGGTDVIDDARARHAVPETVTVRVQTFQFRPTPLAVRAGSRVAWTNQDDIEHTITSGTPERRDSRFASGALVRKGAAHTARFTKPGTYAYYCERHEFMRGEIHVIPTGEPQ